MRFIDKELLPSVYREAFLEAIDEIDQKKEIFSALEKLVPKFKEVFGGLIYRETMNWYQMLIRNKANNNFILFVIDESCRKNEPNAPQIQALDNEKLRKFLEFRDEFYLIINTYDLKFEWLKEHLFNLAYRLSEETRNNPKKISPGSGYSWMPFTSDTFSFNFEPWEITKDSETYKKAVKAAFKQALQNYLNTTAKEARNSNYKRVGKPREIKQHTLWLAWKIIERQSEAQIAAKYNATEDAVKQAIQELHDYIDDLGLERKRGRPKKREY